MILAFGWDKVWTSFPLPLLTFSSLLPVPITSSSLPKFQSLKHLQVSLMGVLAQCWGTEGPCPSVHVHFHSFPVCQVQSCVHCQH
jgi:hypothetical protein